MDITRLLIAGGLTAWLGGLVGLTIFVSRWMRFPKSLVPGSVAWIPAQIRVPVGLPIFAYVAYGAPQVAWPFLVFASGLVVFALGAYFVALRVERRRAERLGLPEPGTSGSLSLAEFRVFLAIALLCAAVALCLTGYGIANEVSGNYSEGGAGLALGAMAWFLAIVMGSFGLIPVFARPRPPSNSAER